MILQFSICVLATLTSVLLLIFSVFVFEQRKSLSNLILSLFLVSNALFLIDYVGVIVQLLLKVTIPGIGTIGMTFGYLFGPLLYLFTQSLTTKEFRFRSIYLGHFIPFLLSGVLLLTALSISPAIHFAVLIIQIFTYLFLCIFTIRRYMKQWEANKSREFQTNLNWLGYVVGGFMVMWAVDVIGFALQYTNPDDSLMVGLAYLLSIIINFIFAIIIFYMALKQPKFLYKLGDDVKYKNSRLSADEKEDILQNIEQYFDIQKPFLNPGLSIKDVSSHLDVPSKYISQVINESLEKNFYDFVNSYRIEEAKSQLITSRDLTISEILYSSGFNTKSAFNTAFKKHTGKTPTQFRNAAFKIS